MITIYTWNFIAGPAVADRNRQHLRFGYRIRLEVLLVLGTLLIASSTVGASKRFSKQSAATKTETRSQAVLTPQRVAKIVEDTFHGLLRVDSTTLSPAYLVGDFNGDGIKDLVICARLHQLLDKNDRRSPAFNVTAPLLGTNRGSRKGVRKSEHYSLGQLARLGNFPLLVILHGQAGRQFEAVDDRNKFILVNCIEPEANRLELFRGRLRNAPRSGDLDVGPAPYLTGDAILIIIRGVGEALYWDRGEYALYPVES